MSSVGPRVSTNRTPVASASTANRTPAHLRPSLALQGRTHTVQDLMRRFEQVDTGTQEETNSLPLFLRTNSVDSSHSISPVKQHPSSRKESVNNNTSSNRIPSPHFPTPAARNTLKTPSTPPVQRKEIVAKVTPSSRVPSRFPRNTYQQSKVKDIRKRFQTSSGSEDSSPSPVKEIVAKINSTDDVKVCPDETPKPPPVKPPRTFAHDVYVQEKEELKILVDQKYRRNRKEEKDSLMTPARRRSRSVEFSPVSPPLSLPKVQAVAPVRRKILKTPTPYHVSQLFESSPAPVKEILRRSFGPADVRAEGRPTVNSTQISKKEVDDKVKYARTLRSKFEGHSTLSHYAAVEYDNPKDFRLCKYFTHYDKRRGSVEVYPKSSDDTKADLVKKFSKYCLEVQDNFCWFSFSEGNFLYAYFLSHDQKVVSVSSHLYSPQFFANVLKSLVSKEGTTSPTSSLTLDSSLVDDLVAKKIPLPGEELNLKGNRIEVPWNQQITSSRPSCLLSNIEAVDIFKSFSTLVHEKRLVFVSGNKSLLIESTKALVSLLYPLQWDYMFWPIVPEDLITFCAALTTPYFIGLSPCHLFAFQAALDKRSEKVLIVDLDSRTLIMEVGDEVKLFPKNRKDYFFSIVNALTSAKVMTDPTETNRDLLMREAFLQIFVDLLGPMTPYITDEPFDKETYIKGADKGQKNFLRWFLETRLFDNFLRHWSLRYIHSKYVCQTNQLKWTDAFERKTQVYRTWNANAPPSAFVSSSHTSRCSQYLPQSSFITANNKTNIKSQNQVKKNGWSRAIEKRFLALNPFK